MTSVATPFPITFTAARNMLMKRSMPRIRAIPATGMAGTTISVPTSVEKDKGTRGAAPTSPWGLPPCVFVFPSHRPSKHIFQCELYLAHVRAGRIDPAESLRRKAEVGITPVRMVREVERLESELKRLILDNPELLMG